jgi:Tol biopolymer transport system component
MIARKRFCFAVISVTVLMAATQFALADGFTLEQILSSPFPSDLIAPKSGDKLAWVFDTEGKRNIWIAEAPAFKGRQLTRYDKDDGQEITELVFSPDGNWIAYVHGGPPNSEKEIPNPTSDAAGAKQEVWLVNTRTGVTVKIAEGSSPMFSPRGDRVIFEREDHLWAATVPIGKRENESISPAPDFQISIPSTLATSTTRNDHCTSSSLSSERLSVTMNNLK